MFSQKMWIIDLIQNTEYEVATKVEIIDLTLRRSTRIKKKPKRLTYSCF